jgi:hypothetical protein
MTDSKKRFNIKVSENKYVPFFPFLFGSNRQKVSFVIRHSQHQQDDSSVNDDDYDDGRHRQSSTTSDATMNLVRRLILKIKKNCIINEFYLISPCISFLFFYQPQQQ